MEEWESFFENYKIPPFTLPLHYPALSFGLAGPGTGVPFHFHGPGFAETIYGRKRWFLTPPDVKPELRLVDHQGAGRSWFLVWWRV